MSSTRFRIAGRPWLVAVAATVAFAGVAPAATPETQPAAVLASGEVAASGSRRVPLDVNRFGRYAVTVTSDQGVSLQLVDRMAGPGEVVGTPGKSDGRLDLILDRSQYLVVTRGDQKASGQAKLTVHPFQELNGEPMPELVELKLVTAPLGDFEQRSYWLRVEEAGWVVIEAAGRHLRDLRLWRDGTWLVEAEPQSEVVEPSVGKPQLACRLATSLEPGTYLLTAYGGEGQPWAAGGEEKPFALRWGIPEVGTSGRRALSVGPFGYDRFLVPRQANLYRLELPEAKPAALTVTPYDDSEPFAEGSDRAEISKRSREPVAELQTEWAEDGLNLVTVRGEAGQRYTLQHFDYRNSYPFKGTGAYWVSTLHTGHPGDAVDVTAILVEWNASGLVKEPRAAQVVELDRGHGFSRRCNLLDPLELYVQVREAGRYRVDLAGVEARFRFEPFLVYRPDDYREPPLRRSGELWDLDAGYFVLTVVPEERGIVSIGVRHEQGPAPTELPPRAAAVLGPLQLASGSSYQLYLNRQPGVKAGVVLRPWREALATPLPLTLRPGEEVEVEWSRPGDGVVTALAEDGSPLELQLDGGAWVEAASAAAPGRSLKVRSRSGETVVASLQFVPRQLVDTEPLPSLPDSDRPAAPELPTVRAGAPLAFDLEKERSSTFAVEATSAALYRLESTGLLDTTGTLRTRTVTALASAEDGGSGRNFLLHQYLRSGDYQVTVATEGESAGHLGLVLTRTEPLDGGALLAGVPARVDLAAGETVLYRFRIAEPGDYRLRAMARDRLVRCRLEDGDGWPVEVPDLEADLTRRLEAGDYRVVLLPEPVEGRRLTVLERLPEAVELQGHGPHPLPLATTVTHRWLEPESGERPPDRWRFELPAAATVAIRLTGEMEADLLRLAPTPQSVGQVPARRGFKGRLEAGSYELAARSARRNNDVRYEVEVAPEELVAGLRRPLTAPGEIAVAVAPGRLVELESFGPADVRATLRDTDGRLVAAGDDRAGDWNFHLAARLDGDRYTLRVEPVGAESAATEVRMTVRSEVEESALPLPSQLELAAGDSVHIWPLDLPAGAELLLASARSSEEHGLACDWQNADGSWRTLASTAGLTPRLELPLPPAGRGRLRLWSTEGRGGSARISVAALRPQRVTEGALARGATLEPVAGFAPAVAVAAVEADRPGSFRLPPSSPRPRWSAALGEPLAERGPGPLVASGGRLWLALDAERPVAVRAERIVLGAGDADPVQLTVPVEGGAVVDLAPFGGGPVVVLATSLVGQPLVAVGDGGARSTAASAVAVGEAVAVALQPRRQAAVWWGSAEARAAEVRVRALRCAAPRSTAVGYGPFSAELLPGSGLALELPAATKRLRLALDAGLVAAVAEGDEVESVLWGGAGRAETLTTRSRRLVLLNPQQEPARFSLDVTAVAAPAPNLLPGQPLETVAPAAGTLRLRLEEPVAASVLRLGGAATAATFVGDRGSVLRGRELPVAGAGVLLLDHDPGLVVAWLDPAAQPLAGLWGGGPAATTTSLTLPTRVDLSGDRVDLRFELAAPGLLEVRSRASAVVRLAAGELERVWLDPTGGAHLAPLAAGVVELGLRGLAGAPLVGDVELATSPVTEIGEGLGPEQLLPPGSGRAFRFTVAAKGQVGVAVRSTSDRAACILLDATGTILGEGVAQMRELVPGDYLLLVRLPADAAPARVRPAVVGLERPSTGPPADVISQYLTEVQP